MRGHGGDRRLVVAFVALHDVLGRVDGDDGPAGGRLQEGQVDGLARHHGPHLDLVGDLPVDHERHGERRGGALAEVGDDRVHEDPAWRVLNTFDWYSPRYQWLHTADEVKHWFSELGFEDVYGPFYITVTLVTWAYISATILLLGANLSSRDLRAPLWHEVEPRSE